MRDLRRRLQAAHCKPCGKWAYRDRQDARNAAKALHPGEHGLRAYECPQGTGMWHFGHNARHGEWVA